MTAAIVICETCRGVTPGGCPHAAPLPADALAALEELAFCARSPEALPRRTLDVYAREMRPGLRFADLAFPGGLPGLPAWALS